MLLLFRALAAHQFIEVALLPLGRLFLIEQREVAFIELLEELLPRNRLQLILRLARKIQPQKTAISLVPGTFHPRRVAPRSSAHLRISS